MSRFSEFCGGGPAGAARGKQWPRLGRVAGGAAPIFLLLILLAATGLAAAAGVADAADIPGAAAAAGGATAAGETGGAASAGTGTDAIKYLPVQEGGRVKPFDSFARESLQLVYGKQSYESASGLKRPAREVVMTWMLASQFWDGEKIIQIHHQGLKDALRLDKARNYFSPAELFRDERLPLVLQELSSKRASKDKLSPYYQAAQRLESAIGLYQSIKEGAGVHPLPPEKSEAAAKGGGSEKAESAERSDRWRAVSELQGEAGERFMTLARAFIRALPQNKGVSAQPAEMGDKIGLDQAVRDFIAYGHRINAAAYGDDSAIQVEVHYNDLRPFM
jgi:hypothetical protein